MYSVSTCSPRRLATCRRQCPQLPVDVTSIPPPHASAGRAKIANLTAAEGNHYVCRFDVAVDDTAAWRHQSKRHRELMPPLVNKPPAGIVPSGLTGTVHDRNSTSCVELSEIRNVDG